MPDKQPPQDKQKTQQQGRELTPQDTQIKGRPPEKSNDNGPRERGRTPTERTR